MLMERQLLRTDRTNGNKLPDLFSEGHQKCLRRPLGVHPILGWQLSLELWAHWRTEVSGHKEVIGSITHRQLLSLCYLFYQTVELPGDCSHQIEGQKNQGRDFCGSNWVNLRRKTIRCPVFGSWMIKGTKVPLICLDLCLWGICMKVFRWYVQTRKRSAPSRQYPHSFKASFSTYFFQLNDLFWETVS